MNDAITVYTYWLVWFTGVLALATIILAGFTIDLALTSRKIHEGYSSSSRLAEAQNLWQRTRSLFMR
ncbi:MAG: hypothetical protein E6L08_05775 [Verrucomicrobia bacterium]|jgi:hypothetical protein|nr:MAG: hypothetical protein DMF26_04575 [Verrucomicrobiota bacterium]TMP93390.1 MAG: hypothetical protein E6L08_05775 [Verrucomicrobiota bacterium]